MFNKLILSGFVTVLPLMLGAIAIPVPSQAQPLIAQTQSTNITDEELKGFAKIILEQAKLAKKTQNNMVAILQQEGLSEKRFKEIAKQQRNSSSQTTEGISPEELQKFQKALPKIQSITETHKEKVKEIVKSEGFTIERFNQIAIKVESDTSLQDKVSKLLGLPE